VGAHDERRSNVDGYQCSGMCAIWRANIYYNFFIMEIWTHVPMS
jgi:hypothetical protein